MSFTVPQNSWKCNQGTQGPVSCFLWKLTSADSASQLPPCLKMSMLIGLFVGKRLLLTQMVKPITKWMEIKKNELNCVIKLSLLRPSYSFMLKTSKECMYDELGHPRGLIFATAVKESHPWLHHTWLEHRGHNQTSLFSSLHATISLV